MRAASAAGFAIAIVAQLSAQQLPPRDAGARTAIGTAAISGIVVTDDREARPVRRARVTLSGANVDLGRTVITDDAGRFSFRSLPAGRFSLGATKEGWISTSFGAKRPGRPGTAIPMSDGQQVANIVLRLPRGAVISGVILDDNGQPAPGTNVRALQYRNVNGERQLAPAFGSATSSTDDRGAYRLYGLAPGEYVISASARNTAFAIGFQGAADMRLTTELDVEKALNELRAGPTAQATPGIAAAQPQPPAPSR